MNNAQPYRRISSRVRSLIAATAAIGLLVASPVHAQQPIEDFDAAWDVVHRTHFDPEFNGVDWEAVRDELRPLAVDASAAEVRGIIMEMVNRLGQSHFGLLPREGAAIVPFGTDEMRNDIRVLPEQLIAEIELTRPVTELSIAPDQDAPGTADPGLDVRLIGGQIVVVGIDRDSGAEDAGVQRGWTLIAVGKLEVADMVRSILENQPPASSSLYAKQGIDASLMGPPGSSARVVFRNGDNEELTLDLKRQVHEDPAVAFGQLPPMSPRFDAFELPGEQYGLGPDTSIGYITFDVWLPSISMKFDAAMVEFADADGLVIDLRGNLGGVGIIASTVGRYLVDEQGSLGTMSMRDQELHFNMMPVMVSMTTAEALDPFEGRVAVLIDEGSASTSEIFAAGIREMGRARLFGSPTPGLALPAMLSPLPSGDILMHAMAGFETPEGVSLEAAGVVPDEILPWDRDSLLAGLDEALSRAVIWAAGADE